MAEYPGEMEIVAFGFTEGSYAASAETELRLLLDVEDHDLEVEEVGGTHEFVNGYTVVLAGRIREHRVEAARQVVRRHGGEVLTEVPEVWAMPRPSSSEPDGGLTAP